MLACPACNGQMPVLDPAANTAMALCIRCGISWNVAVFPAMAHGTGRGRVGTAVEGNGEASCFFHESKKGETICDLCGRFLCSLCDIHITEKHLCPQCLERARKNRTLNCLDDRRVLYDSAALALAILPLIFIWPTIITAPASLYVAIRYWRDPLGIVRKRRVRYYIAVVLSSLQIIAWFAVLIYLIGRT